MKKNIRFGASLLVIALFNSMGYCSKPDQKAAAEVSSGSSFKKFEDHEVVEDATTRYPHLKFMIDIGVKIGSVRDRNDPIFMKFCSLKKYFNALGSKIDFQEFENIFNPSVPAQSNDAKRVEQLFKALDSHLLALDPEMPAIFEAERQAQQARETELQAQQQIQQNQVNLAQENARLKEELKKLQEKIAHEAAPSSK